uniref:Uncharacterized protein n=1 Tax=Anguilla anguilla TaxID=7936 RepID=A0A0E9SKX6_ANGAN
MCNPGSNAIPRHKTEIKYDSPFFLSIKAVNIK